MYLYFFAHWLDSSVCLLCTQAGLQRVLDTASWAAAVRAVEAAVAPLLPGSTSPDQGHIRCCEEEPAAAAFSLDSIPLAGSDSLVFLLEGSGLAVKFFTDEVGVTLTHSREDMHWGGRGALCPAGGERPFNLVLHGRGEGPRNLGLLHRPAQHGRSAV